jgi:hypothetical protein
MTVKQKYSALVAKGGKRPCIKNKLPSMTKEIMKSSWMSSPFARPSMGNICRMIKVDLQELETEEKILMLSLSRFCNSDQIAFEESRHEFSFHLSSLDKCNAK